MKIKKFTEHKLNERIETDNIEDVKGYLHRINPSDYTQEWLDGQSLTRLLRYAVVENFKKIQNNLDRNIPNYQMGNTNDMNQELYEETFNRSLDFLSVLESFNFVNVKPLG